MMSSETSAVSFQAPPQQPLRPRVILNFELTASTFLQLLFSALVAGLTVGGKACGKSFAIGCSNRIVHTVARVICFFRTLPRRLGRLFGRHKKS